MRKERDKESSLLVITKGLRNGAPLLTAGIQLAAATGIIGLIGYWLDHFWNTTPWLMVVGIFLGAGAGMYLFVKTVTDVTKEEQHN